MGPPPKERPHRGTRLPHSLADGCASGASPAPPYRGGDDLPALAFISPSFEKPQSGPGCRIKGEARLPGAGRRWWLIHRLRPSSWQWSKGSRSARLPTFCAGCVPAHSAGVAAPGPIRPAVLVRLPGAPGAPGWRSIVFPIGSAYRWLWIIPRRSPDEPGRAWNLPPKGKALQRADFAPQSTAESGGTTAPAACRWRGLFPPRLGWPVPIRHLDLPPHPVIPGGGNPLSGRKTCFRMEGIPHRTDTAGSCIAALAQSAESGCPAPAVRGMTPHQAGHPALDMAGPRPPGRRAFPHPTCPAVGGASGPSTPIGWEDRAITTA